jgi:hypothetical protein
VLSAGWQADSLLLSWTGGIAPYQVQATTNPASPFWENFGTPSGANNLLIARTNEATFYRVFGQ